MRPAALTVIGVLAVSFGFWLALVLGVHHLVKAQGVWPSLPPPEYEQGLFTATTVIVNDPQAECIKRGVAWPREHWRWEACYDARADQIIMPPHFFGGGQWWADLYRHEAAHARGHPHDPRWPK